MRNLYTELIEKYRNLNRMNEIKEATDFKTAILYHIREFYDKPQNYALIFMLVPCQSIGIL